jgi:hypothetical protein
MNVKVTFEMIKSPEVLVEQPVHSSIEISTVSGISHPAFILAFNSVSKNN